MAGQFRRFLLALTLLQPMTWAQNRSVSTTILLTTETAIPLVSTPPLKHSTTPANSTTCDPAQPTCPACEGVIISNDFDSNYEVYCDAYISSSAISLQSTLITPFECLMACDGFFGCTGAYINGEGTCTLSIGSVFGTLKLDGYIGFVSIADTPENSSNATYSSNSTKLASSTRSSLQPMATPYSNVTYTHLASSSRQIPSAGYPYPYPNATSSSNATAPMSTASPSNSTCSINRLTCPACANQTITDLHDTSYTVLCDFVLESTSQYVFAEPLPVAYCLAQCDERNATCIGASWSDEECTLVLGTLNGRLQMPGYLAFIPTRAAAGAARSNSPSMVTGTGSPQLTTGLTWLNMSAYPTGSLTTAHRTTTLNTTSSVPTTFSIPPIPLPSPTCDQSSPTCPECDGLRLLDGNNATYRIQCNFAPTCDSTLGFYGQWSLNVCMERCDADATCVAAIFNDGQCDFCQGSMDSEYEGQFGYLVLIPETPAPVVNGTGGANAPAATSTPSSTPTGETACNATSPMCPACADAQITTDDGAAWEVHCYDMPACSYDVTVNDLRSWNFCLEYCSQDAECASATFANGTCRLCEAADEDATSWAAVRPVERPWAPFAVVPVQAAGRMGPGDEGEEDGEETTSTFSTSIPPRTGAPMFFTGVPSTSTPEVTTDVGRITDRRLRHLRSS